MNIAALSVQVRAACGKVTNTTELEEADIVATSARIVSRIAEIGSSCSLRSFTSVANQREYSVNTATTRVKKVLQWATIQNDLSELGSIFVPTSLSPYGEYYTFPSLRTLDSSLQQYAATHIKFEFDPITRKISVDPYPQVGGDLYWYVSIEHGGWTAATVPADFENLLVLGTAWRCMEIIVAKRSGLGGIQRPGGMLDYPAPSMQSVIDSKKLEFEQELERMGKIYFS
jgi:hypothetical protein